MRFTQIILFFGIFFPLFVVNLPAQDVRQFNALETHKPLINPWSGLVNYGMESCYGPYLRKIPHYIYPESMVYLRPVWGDLEPEERKLDLKEFETIRDQHLQGGAKQWAFRIVTAMPNEAFEHATPHWVRKAGAKGNRTSRGGWEPHYSDPVYQQKFEQFIQQIAERYDGDPTLAFVDISGFGYYSEWGDPGTPQKGWDNPEDAEETTRKLINIFFKAFKKTPLAISTHIIGPNMEDRYSVKYALEHGAWNRRDGVGSPFFHQGHKQLVKKTWPDRPIITEWYGIYANYNDTTTGRNRNWSGWNFTDAVDQALDQHGMVAEMSRDLDKTNAVLEHPAFDRLVLKIGHRLVLSKAFFPSALDAGEPLIVQQIWKNQGVAKLYVKYPLRVYLFDENGQVIWSAIDHDFDPTGWKRGKMYEYHSSFQLPGKLPAGTCELGIALVDPEGKPAIQLAMEGDRGDRIYQIGKININNTRSSGAGAYEEPPLDINLARLLDATGHVETVNKARPFYYVAPLNDGLMRLSVSDTPGKIGTTRQSYGITWEEEKEFNTVRYFAGETVAGEGGWFERDLWVEMLKDGKWREVKLVAWKPVYPLDQSAGGKVYTITFNTRRAKGVRIGGLAGRRHSKWVSVREIEVFNRNK